MGGVGGHPGRGGETDLSVHVHVKAEIHVTLHGVAADRVGDATTFHVGLPVADVEATETDAGRKVEVDPDGV